MALKFGKLILIVGVAIATVVGISAAAAVSLSNTNPATLDLAEQNSPSSTEQFPRLDDNSQMIDDGIGATDSENDFAPVDTPEEASPPISSPSSSDGITRYQVFNEPREGAFKMLIPAGWSGETAISRPANGLAVGMLAKDSTKALFFESPRATSYFQAGQSRMETCQFYASYGTTSPDCQEGNWYLESYVYHYLSADEYVQQFLLPEYRQTVSQDIQLVDASPLDNINSLSAYQAKALVSGGEYIFSYTNNLGDGSRMYVSVVTSAVMSPSGDLLWYVDLFGVAAPDSEFDNTLDSAFASVSTLTLNRDWLISEINRMGGSAESASQADNQARERSSSMFSEYLRGSHEEVNVSTGERFTVPNIENYWWYNPSSREIIGSPTNDNPAPLEGFIQLSRAT